MSELIQVVTYQSDRGATISVCADCERRLAGSWPKDDKGSEYATVQLGLHEGLCDVHPGQPSQALALADEYRALRARGDVARLGSIKATIEDLVGAFVDGKLTIPAPVRAAMGI